MSKDSIRFSNEAGRGGREAPLPPRPPYRPPVGIPLRRDDDYRVGTIVSVVFHALIIALILLPLIFPEAVTAVVGGAGGPGPAGGGGGGTRGSGGRERITPERLQYIQVQPPKAQPTPAPTVVPPKVEEKKPEEQKAEPIPEVKPELPTTTIDLATMAGIGGGTGTDGTGGSGPGTGGGVGSGVGTGRGSANGPGTGGGEGMIYPPRPDQLIIPPIPIPERIRGRTIVATFDIDEQGKILSIDFNSSGDRGYDKKLRERLESFRFRPAVRADTGAPVRARYPVEIAL